MTRAEYTHHQALRVFRGADQPSVSEIMREAGASSTKAQDIWFAVKEQAAMMGHRFLKELFVSRAGEPVPEWRAR